MSTVINTPNSHREAFASRERELEPYGMNPWQMTSKEYEKLLHQTVKREKPQNKFWMPEATLIACMELERIQTIKRRTEGHRWAVRHALSRGKKVPKRVLAEYGL